MALRKPSVGRLQIREPVGNEMWGHMKSCRDGRFVDERVFAGNDPSTARLKSTVDRKRDSQFHGREQYVLRRSLGR